MKQKTENVTTDALQMPATSAIHMFGYAIPVLDHVLVGEAVELEKLTERTDLSAIETNLEAVAIFIRHRLDKPVSAKDLLRQPITDIVAFEEGVNQLLRPFTEAYARAKVRRAETLKQGIKNAIRLIGDASKAN